MSANHGPVAKKEQSWQQSNTDPSTIFLWWAHLLHVRVERKTRMLRYFTGMYSSRARLLAAPLIALFTILLFSSQAAFAQGVSAPPGHATTLRDGGDRLGIHIGSAVRDDALSNDAQYAQILGQQFSAITPENEMKWASIEATRGVFTYGPADAEVQFAQRHNQLVRGHNLVWDSQLPNWVTTGNFTNAQLADILHLHIIEEVTHFRGEIWQWDVVNEPLNEDGTLKASIWEKALGPGYIAQALKWAHQADPRAQLFVNDFNIEFTGAKSNAMLALAQSLIQQGAPLDGIGFETHLGLQFGLPDVQNVFPRFTNLGLKIDVTEMDVRMILPATPALLAQQASWYSTVMQACIALHHCVDFTVWEYTDKYSWIPGFFTGQGSGDIFDETFTPKPSYTAVLDALNNPSSPQHHN
jgi:endo-1,4-beta-xylanase